MKGWPTPRSITAVAPVAVLGIIGVGLLWINVPKDNQDLLGQVVAGFLGFIARAATERKGEPTP